MKKKLYIKTNDKEIFIAYGKEEKLEKLKKAMLNDKYKTKKFRIEEIIIK